MAAPIIVIIGPTAVGKTAVAMALQDRLGGPSRAALISADSAMVYRGMDIGSAKPTGAELAAHPHDLIDIRDPWQPYNVADFVQDADESVRRHRRAGRIPVIVGGTMLYVKRFVEGIAELPPADPALRAELERELVERGNEGLHAELAALDPAAAAQIHQNNPQRLLRALEVVRLTGQPLSAQWRSNRSAQQRHAGELVVFAIEPDRRAQLHELIERRFDQMLELGLVEELHWLRRALAERGLQDMDLPATRAVGYRQGLEFLAGRTDLEGFRRTAVTATRRLAKRQLTWLRQWPDIRRLCWGPEQQLAAQIGVMADVDPA